MYRADRWMESGGPETVAVSTPKMCVCVPLTSPEGCFHAATKVVWLILIWMGFAPLVFSARSLSTCLHRERQEQQASELPLHDVMISSLMMLLSASLFLSGCSLQRWQLFSLIKLIVNLITLTICKVAM